MSFLRHVGKIGDRKVAIVFREVPNEPHMALAVYTESLNRHVHDPLMKCIESDIGQNSENLADALNRTHTNDGKIILQVLHKEGLLKKVQTSQVIMTPNTKTNIKLEELNKMLNEMQQGEEAVKRMAEIDDSRGMQSSAEVARRMRNKDAQTTPPPKGIQATSNDVLGDTVLANNLIQQAVRMESEAKGLLAESARLQKEASELMGTPIETQTAKPTVSTTASVKRGRGRPAKSTLTL
jgi:hypothetical protein